MSIETVRVPPARSPPTISTTPNSPIVCAKLRTTAVTTPGLESGRNAPKCSQASSAENGGSIEQFAVNRLERRDERLYRERQAVKDGGEDKTHERERQTV